MRLGSSPYAYAKVDVGRSNGEQLMTFETRVRYEPFDAERIQEQVFVPLPHDWHIRFGFDASPTRSNYRDNERFTTSVFLDHSIGSHSCPLCTFYIGLTTNEAVRTAMIGIFR